MCVPSQSDVLQTHFCFCFLFFCECVSLPERWGGVGDGVARGAGPFVVLGSFRTRVFLFFAEFLGRRTKNWLSKNTHNSRHLQSRPRRSEHLCACLCRLHQLARFATLALRCVPGGFVKMPTVGASISDWFGVSNVLV